MDANKKRDIAKDFAEFLMREKKQLEGEKQAPPEDKEPSSPVEPVYDAQGLPDIHSLVKERPPHLTTIRAGEENELSPQTQQSVPSKPALSSAPRVQEKVEAPKASVFEEVNKIVGQVESIRAAQARIQALETEREDLRNEASRLVIMCDELTKALADSKEKFDGAQVHWQKTTEENDRERKTLNEKLASKESEIKELKAKNNMLEARFNDDLKKVRAKEREYENINMIMKAEAQAIARAKDEMILDLKRKLDQLHTEFDSYKAIVNKNQSQMDEWRKRQSEALNSLRQGLHILDGEDVVTQVGQVGPKKASGGEKN